METKNNLLHKEITDKIIKSFFNVYYELGYGFLEKVYENALMIGPKEMELKFILCDVITGVTGQVEIGKLIKH